MSAENFSRTPEAIADDLFKGVIKSNDEKITSYYGNLINALALKKAPGVDQVVLPANDEIAYSLFIEAKVFPSAIMVFLAAELKRFLELPDEEKSEVRQSYES